MTAKEYLRQIEELDRKVENCRKYYERCQKDIARLKSPRWDTDRVQASGSDAGFAASVEKLIDIQARTNQAIDDYIDKRDKIICQINGLEGLPCSILFKKYIEYKTFDQIANEIGKSYGRTTHMHGEALALFKEKYM